MSETEPADGRTARSVVVTGAARGIGAATAELFGAERARVLVVDRDPSVHKVAETMAAVGAEARALVVDLADAAAAEAIVRNMLEWTGRLDVLVNNAALHRRLGSIEATDGATWDDTMAVNVRSIFLLCRQALPALGEVGGVIVNVASIVGPVIGSTVSLPYAASKAAVVGLTRSLALEVAARGIRVNCVCPGPIDTDLTLRSLADRGSGQSADEAIRTLTASVPVGRLGTAAEVAAAIGFLASAAASFITGAALVVDGGLSVR
jgi:NAD(P)-dependent dehydrogenase (short-subunit alcohol dehydrogenase family)